MTDLTTEPSVTFAGQKSDLVRCLPETFELRDGDGGGGGTTMFGHFAVFNRWTTIDSFWEGRFLERIAPGAFKKTMKENRDTIKCLVEHGYDPAIGKRALGTIDELKEDDTGGYYEVSLVDAQDVRELILPRLRVGLYGASFRFSVMREEIVEEPDQSEDNPHGLPERTIKECRLFEFGPVTFPAYADATAGARSLTDEFCPAAIMARDRAALVRRMDVDPELRALMTGKPAAEPGVVVEPKDDAGDGKGDGEGKERKQTGAERRKINAAPLYGLNMGKQPWRL